MTEDLVYRMGTSALNYPELTPPEIFAVHVEELEKAGRLTFTTRSRISLASNIDQMIFLSPDKKEHFVTRVLARGQLTKTGHFKYTGNIPEDFKQQLLAEKERGYRWFYLEKVSGLSPFGKGQYVLSRKSTAEDVITSFEKNPRSPFRYVKPSD